MYSKCFWLLPMRMLSFYTCACNDQPTHVYVHAYINRQRELQILAKEVLKMSDFQAQNHLQNMTICLGPQEMMSSTCKGCDTEMPELSRLSGGLCGGL